MYITKQNSVPLQVTNKYLQMNIVAEAILFLETVASIWNKLFLYIVLKWTGSALCPLCRP